MPFLADGRCVLITEPGGPALLAGPVRDGEDYVLDTVLRVPLETAGFRYQRFHPFGLDGDHLYAWIEGAPYSGDRPHRTVPLSFCAAEEAAETVTALGFRCAGQTGGGDRPGRVPLPTAWINGGEG